MKQVKYRGFVNGKLVKGNWFCESVVDAKSKRVNLLRIAERLQGHKIDRFVPVVIDVKEHMIKEEE